MKEVSRTEDSFWQGMIVEQIYKKEKDLILKGKGALGETIEFPLAEEFILERDKPDYSQDARLRRDEITGEYLKENIPQNHVMLGVKYNISQKRYEIVQIALPDGWCWDET